MSKDFNIDENFILIKSKKDKTEFSTSFTLLNLNYDTYDIIDILKKLSLEDYSETLIDKDDDRPPLLFVFGKNINDKMVYIKLKIKGEARRKVLCLSFHYAEYDMNFPYA